MVAKARAESRLGTPRRARRDAYVEEPPAVELEASGAAEALDERVTVIGPERLADLVLEAGLSTWLIRKVP
jgi:hypothetical protein